MVFTSAPNYIDSTNWTQQINLQAGCNLENMQQTALSLPEGFSMDRAQPKAAEKAVKCPRCGSRNTKFCYFNNYSLSQPRYICKTCRRYWTRGGALRSVPMGGGCRKNKNGKSTRCAKSKAQPKGRASTSSTSTSSSKDAIPSSSFTIGTLNTQPPQFSFMNSLHQINDYRSSGMDLNFGSFQSPTGLPMEISASLNVVGVQSRSIMEQWRQQQLPCLTGFETQQAYFGIGANEGLRYDMGGGQAWMKMEEEQRILNGAVAMGGQISLYQPNFK